MATRSDANGEHYTKAFGLTDACTVSFWAKITTDRTAKSGMFSISSATTNFMVGTSTGGTGIKFEQTLGASASANPGSFTVGTWYKIGLIHAAGSTAIGYYGTGTGALSTSTLTGFVWAATTSMTIGCEPTTTNWLNGSVANFKAWDTNLSVAELTQEFMTVAPLRRANLSHYHDFTTAEVYDYSGLNRNLSGGTGATSEAGPPIPVRRRNRYMIIPPEPYVPPIPRRDRVRSEALNRSYYY